MSKSNKIIVVAVSVTLALCLVVIGAASVLTSKNKPSQQPVSQTVPTVAMDSTNQSGEIIVQTDPNTGETVAADSSMPTTVITTTPFTSTTAPAAPDFSGMIIGKWMDSAGMSGFEFFPDGKVSFTYVNLSSFNIPFDGTARNGMYTIEGNTLTIKFSIYTATIEKKYEISIENDVLSMKDLEERETATYTKVDTSSVVETTSVPTSVPSTVPSTETPEPTSGVTAPAVLEGTFVSGDNENKLTFNSNGTVTVEKKKDTFSGVFQVTGSKLLIVYIDDGDSISEEYEHTLNGNILTLTNSKGESSVYVKQ